MPANTQISSKTLADLAYQKLRNGIISGELKPGEKLRLTNLQEHYVISMSPLREALARLVGDSLVMTEGQRGFWVAPLSLEELDDISRVRSMLEQEALQISMMNGDERYKEELTAAFEKLSKAESELNGRKRSAVPEWEQANAVFHEVLVSRCDSSWLKRMINMLIQQSERYRHISITNAPVSNRDVHEEHQAIYEAVMADNVLKACKLIDMHQRLTTETVREAIKEKLN